MVSGPWSVVDCWQPFFTTDYGPLTTDHPKNTARPEQLSLLSLAAQQRGIVGSPWVRLSSLTFLGPRVFSVGLEGPTYVRTCIPPRLAGRGG